MDQQQMKQAAAKAALELIRDWVQPDSVLGVGTGTTADQFIDQLGASGLRCAGAVASSERSAQRLAAQGLRVLALNDIDELPVYVDGADEINARLEMIKGGGGALTREKIVASAARRFVCIADRSKLVERLGAFGLPIEVIPMAQRQVERRLAALPGRSDDGPRLRLRRAEDGQPWLTDNGNYVIDVLDLAIAHPQELEARIDGITGVVCNGLFARRPADVLLLARQDGVQRILSSA